MEIFTIGFAQKSAKEFFTLLKQHEVQRLIDVRLNNSNQLAGFTKQRDLEYFLREIADIEYSHEPLLAPTQDLMTGFRNDRYSWAEYEQIYGQLLEEREIRRAFSPDDFGERSVLLCSEPTPEHCHRRLIAEFFQRHWDDVQIVHL